MTSSKYVHLPSWFPAANLFSHLIVPVLISSCCLFCSSRTETTELWCNWHLQSEAIFWGCIGSSKGSLLWDEYIACVLMISSASFACLMGNSGRLHENASARQLIWCCLYNWGQLPCTWPGRPSTSFMPVPYVCFLLSLSWTCNLVHGQICSLETFFPLVAGLASVQTGCGVYGHRVTQLIAVTVLGSLLKSLQCWDLLPWHVSYLCVLGALNLALRMLFLSQ